MSLQIEKQDRLVFIPLTKEENQISKAFKKLAIHQISYSGLGTKSGGPLGGEKQQSKCAAA